MGKIIEYGAQCSTPKSREALAIVSDDYMDVMALDPKSHMTTVTVASHFLYDKSRPDILLGPGGALHISDATYEQVAYNHVRLRGPRWEPELEGEYTLKLEGARTTGYYASVIGTFRDPILISQLDIMISTLESFIKEKMDKVPYDLKIHRCGINGVMGQLEHDTSLSKKVCVVVQACGATQEIANQIASACKFGFCYIGYKGQVATAGNFAWPFTPCEMPAGLLAEFCVYNIMRKSDPVALCPIKAHTIEGTNTYIQSTRKRFFNISLLQSLTHPAILTLGSVRPVLVNRVSKTKEPKTYFLKPEPEAGTCYLADIASVVRSKNVGPYGLTLDVMFDNKDTYEKFKSFDLLNKSVIAKLYSITEKEALV